jgi:hypothetical protein
MIAALKKIIDVTIRIRMAIYGSSFVVETGEIYGCGCMSQRKLNGWLKDSKEDGRVLLIMSLLCSHRGELRKR